jgi:NADH-quinone oxidoreductase subunit J
MSPTFAILSLLTIASAVAAMTLRNLVHCALSVAVSFAGLAALYLQLDAQFVGFAQVLIYIGAVTVLIVFAILLTRSSEPVQQPILSPSWLVGGAIAVLVFGILSGMIVSSKALTGAVAPAPQATVGQIGNALMSKYILPLEVIGLLLTAALIGAVIIAMREEQPK